MLSTIRAALISSVVLLSMPAWNAQAGETDPDTIWPLCGRITENPPAGWVDTNGCPSERAGDPVYSDEPLSATFGPRPLASESNRYDFHRGVDIATPIGTPFFAITDGTVEIAGDHPSYSDPLIKLRHFRPGETSCNAGGCYHSFYLHIDSWVVNENDTVVKGQLLGYTGESGSGFDHVHFELRDAPDFDVFSAWQRDAIHPLSVVPYSAPNNTTITFNNVDFTNQSAGIVDLNLVSNRFDLVKVDVALFDADQQPIAQPGDTPDALGYYIEPSVWDMENTNFMYTHKDSANFPWSSFGAGGANECPYHADHGSNYEAGLHMDQQLPGNQFEGLFNGVHIRTQKYWPSDVDDYEVELEFLALQGTPTCIQATATFASGDTETAEWGTCGPVSSAQLLRGPYLQMQTDDGVTVKWRTDLATDSVVRFGTSAGDLNQTASVGGSRTDHEVTLSGLGADQQYWYSVGDSVSAIAGDSTYHFSTAPAQGSAADSRIWVIGDSGTANQDARDVRDAFKAYTSADPADIWLMLGDNAYNDGTDAEYQAAVFDTYPVLLRQLPLWSTLGNHDGHSADSGTQTGPYFDIFNLPANGEIGGLSSGTEAYYSFDYANIHFVCLDSYDTDRSADGTMLTWLESDLATNTQPWVIAFWHHPPYSKGSHDSDTEGRLIDMRQNALPILEAWGVDLVMTGHSHSYERSYLIDGHYGSSGTLDPDLNVLDPGDGWDLGDGAYNKPDVIAAQNAGSVYAVAGSSGKISGGSLDHPAMFVNLNALGSLVIDVSGNRMDVVFIDENATVQDIFTIEKTPDTNPPLLTAATAEDATHVLVDFNETLDPVSAQDIANYSIGGLTISDAVLQADDRSVRLTTSAMTPEANYTLTVNNVQDSSGNTIAPNSQISFDFYEFVTVSFQDGLLPDPGYFGTQDGYIREASPDTLHGAETTLQVDGDEPSGQSMDMNIVIQWQTDSIPTNAIIEDAHLELEVTNISEGSYECYALLTGWDEDEVTWNQAFNGVSWGSPGASSGSDRGADVVCSVNAGSTGPLTVDFNSDGLALIQDWLNTPAANHGIIIANPTNSNGADFHASESATAMARPKLVVTYRVPVAPPNADPVAGFTHSCTDLDCAFTDTSTDSDGTIVSWNWDFGDGNASTAQHPGHSYAAAGTYTVSLTVTDDGGASAGTDTPVSVTAPPGEVDQYANGSTTGEGTVSGSYLDTHADDGVVQAITELQTRGKPSRRRTSLEHRWTFNVVAGSSATLSANAWISGPPDVDHYIFSYSTDGNNFTDVFTVTSANNGNLQSASLPSDLSGTVYIRVVDSDNSQGETVQGEISVDELVIRTVTTTNPVPDAPGNLQATTFSNGQIDLAWSDNSGNEDGFRVERSPTGTGSWSQIASLGADVTTYSDTGLGAGTTHHYRVFAHNAAGDSTSSNTASASTFTIPRTITFAGRSWTVKQAASPVGPGPNYFGDTADDVWVDGNGHLHMRIEFRDGNWHSSEVIGDDVLGYGTYTVTLGSRVDLLDRNVVVGLFTWDSSAPEFNYREIDIEFARWGDPLNDNSQYVVQPWDTAGNTLRWETTLTGTDSTHAFTWASDQVQFSSFQGDPPGAAIQSWTYTGSDVPPEGTTSGNMRINFWLMGGNAPFDGQEAELIVKSFDYTPPGSNNPPSAAFTDSCTDLDCNFTDTSSDSDGNIVSWAWDFGDGNASTAQNPNHGYAAAGSYTVSLTVTDDDGATDNTSTLVTVTDPPAGLAVESITPNTSPMPNTLAVTVSGSGFQDGASLSFSGGSGPTPAVSNVSVVDSSTLTATVDIKSGGPPRDRAWNVTVTNPGGASDTLSNGFVVTAGG